MIAPIERADVPDSLIMAARLLREGGIVVIPTDTVYGLAASIWQPAAVARIYEVKERAPEARVPVLIASAADLTAVTRTVPEIAWPLINAFWPGALTLVLPAKRDLPLELTRGSATIAVRVPAARSALRLLEVLGEPIVGTSANISGRPAAATALAAQRDLGERVDLILEDDQSVAGGPPSTLVDLTGQHVVIRRAGAVPEQAVRAAVGDRALVRTGVGGQKP